MRIVLCDQDIQFIQTLSQVCHEGSIQFDVYDDPSQTFDIATKQALNIDLIIVSCELKDNENAGFEIAQKLRHTAQTADIPFILVSSKLSNIAFMNHQKGPDGANAYLRKPVAPGVIASTIESVTGIKIPRQGELSSQIVLIETAKILSEVLRNNAQRSSEMPVTLFPDESHSKPSMQVEHPKGEDQPKVEERAAPPQSIEIELDLTLENPLPIETASTKEENKEIYIDLEQPSEQPIQQPIEQPLELPIAKDADKLQDQALAEDLPYLFGGGLSSVTIQAHQAERPKPVDFNEPQTESYRDVDTLKKYLMMREQDTAILSAQLSYAKEELVKSEQTIKRLATEVETLTIQNDDKNKQIENLERELAHAGKSVEGDLEQLRFEVKAKVDRIKFLEDQLSNSSVQYEKLRERVRQDIRKIRVREKELENKLEILKRDSETLIAARESKILELKRKIDILEFNYDTLQDQNENEKANVSQAQEKIAKVVKVLKLAMGIIEGESEQSKNQNESDIKVA